MVLKFDTRDKKPKLFNLLILTVVSLIAAALLITVSPSGNIGAVCLLIAAYCFFAEFTLIYSFCEQIRYNPYSYNTIIYFGFALFAFSVMITHIVLAVRIFKYPEIYRADEVIRSLLTSAKNYIFISSPFLLIFFAALCLSNISLIRHEGMRFVNLLGIFLSFVIVAGEVFIFTFDFAVSGSRLEVMLHDLITNFLASLYLYFECMLIGTIVAGAVTARYEPEKNIDFLIILGCGLKKDGTPTPLLRGRVERAVAFYEKQKSLTGKDLIFITSGGKGDDEIISESAAMKRCLIDCGVHEKNIIEEDRSKNTFENMKFSKEKIQKINPEGKIAFSTTNYHVFRSGIFARRVKMRAVGMGAKTKWYFWPNAAVREFAGLLVNHRVKQALILGGTAVFYAVLTIFAYNK